MTRLTPGHQYRGAAVILGFMLVTMLLTGCSKMLKLAVHNHTKQRLDVFEMNFNPPAKLGSVDAGGTSSIDMAKHAGSYVWLQFRSANGTVVQTIKEPSGHAWGRLHGNTLEVEVPADASTGLERK